MPVSYAQKPLLGKLTLTSQLSAETGLHIGGGGENLDIGGLDKPVIRDPLTKYPYLPGSSIKGKLRSILERLLNKPLNRSGGSGTWRYESDDLNDGFTEVEAGRFIAYEGANTCQISRLFGSTGGSKFWMPIETAREEGLYEENKNNPTSTINNQNCIRINRGRNAPARLMIRDCHLVTESAEKLKQVDTGLYMTEWKFENGIDRVTAAANPRQLERVPAGSKFQFELVYTVENKNQVIEDLQNIAIALAILEDDALGGHGSRGYGKVRFQNFQFSYRSLEQYRQMTSTPPGTSALQPLETIPNTQALLDNFGSLSEYVNRLLPGD
ncbi:type III-A CRISPR-associated RAMP protein Csm3 [Fischerella thermalis]|uniref:type III-A CRISPR-associated RAMP protein Csm3 n=1 Tax=Fischerella thermalis TaxID=372787 RepID=UPI000C8062CD|nr:type III-A CRISPR-associated RAMP protein Csm3 [Fischerella thermalis]PLZ12856.1 type III-A CRISPR-associated RAMP protein Csm3 [Fischerella thermalis WC114]PLZ23222.1 type III-A CRISPR-associated RAMP protein Csm3 [Fischerella thermalis WC157]PLZ24439.1 type III-A CRISPR-associated RAMP protein Csm3 [Fischerella thermalis WC341]PLZ46996.1 type III-A CRISPR-associated RAMP protein Csm3 [Fischerella thermalis WC441]PLZ63429.1 type III-A CRISPR-associated RAMP protein Csm3 [Fischerella therma